jgi:hypothetical protein
MFIEIYLCEFTNKQALRMVIKTLLTVLLILLVGPRRLSSRNVLQPYRLIVLTLLWKFPLALPGALRPTTTRETPSRERGNFGREMSGNFADNGDFHVIAEIFYMPQICDAGPKALLPLRRTGCSGFFRPEKSDGFGRVRTRELGYQRPECYP